MSRIPWSRSASSRHGTRAWFFRTLSGKGQRLAASRKPWRLGRVILAV